MKYSNRENTYIGVVDGAGDGVGGQDAQRLPWAVVGGSWGFEKSGSFQSLLEIADVVYDVLDDLQFAEFAVFGHERDQILQSGQVDLELLFFDVTPLRHAALGFHFGRRRDDLRDFRVKKFPDGLRGISGDKRRGWHFF